MINLIILSWLWTFLSENASSRMKKIWEKLTFYQKWFILTLCKIFFTIFLLLTVWTWTLTLNNLSFLLIVLYSLLWILFTYFAMNAINKADRSTNSLFSVLVLPLLLISDILLWYNINIYHIIWVLFIVLILVLSTWKWPISTKWIKYIIWAQIVASIWITVYKYLITHFVSVETILLIDSLIMMSIFVSITIYKLWILWIRESLYFKNIKFWIFSGLWQTIWLFAYMFWPASIVTAIKRILQMSWWVVFWRFVFNEVNFWKKIANLWVLSIWVLIMNFQSISAHTSFLTDINTSLFRWDVNAYKQHLEQTFDVENFSENIKDWYFKYIN